MKKISETILNILSQMTVNENVLEKYGPQLDRATYKDLNDVLTALGGKWDRRAQGHVFETDPSDIIEEALQSGEYSNRKQDYGMFFTPIEVVADIMDDAPSDLTGMSVLEPSAGRGAIVGYLLALNATVYATEIDPTNRSHLAKMNINLYKEPDFLKLQPTPTRMVDMVVMNPPFAKQADIDHVLHAFKFVKPGGRLISIMSASVSFRSNNKTVAFREFVESHDGTITHLEPGAFHSSGTDVNAVVVTMEAA